LTADDGPTFNEVIHAPQRLRICAMLNGAHKVEFRLLQDHLGLSKSALSKHLTLLVDAGYVRQERAVRNSRNRLCLSLTPEGARAYSAHVQALQQIVATRDM
jgi:DNA-binding MarR family transcriptional regulator